MEPGDHPLRTNYSIKSDDSLAGDLADRERLERSGFVEEHQSIPEWIEVLNVFYRVIDDRQIMVLYTRPEA